MKLSNDARPAEKKRILIISNPFLFHVIQFKFPPLPTTDDGKYGAFQITPSTFNFHFSSEESLAKIAFEPFQMQIFCTFSTIQ